MTSQRASSGPFMLAILVLVVIALLGVVGTAGAAGPAGGGPRGCRAGFKAVAKKVTRKDGKTKVERVCRKKATKAPLPSTGPAPAATPAAAGAAEPAPGPTPASVPVSSPLPEEEPSEEVGETEVQATIGTGFSQNPLVPDEVTWHYSAAGTRTVTVEGVETTESVPLPEGELAFFVDGKLECEIHAIGAIAGSACTVVLQQLGAHEVEAIFSNATLSDVASRTDYVGRYPTATNLQVSVEPVAPEYLDIGPNAYGFEQYAFEVGRLRISGSTTPGFVPFFDCTGQAVGCIEPETSLNRNGTASLPLYAQHRLNMATGEEEWHVGFDAYSPSLREYGWFWQFPQESIGAEFFHAVGEPDPRLYEPSSVTVPLNLNGGHYPLYHWFRQGEGGGSVAAVEGTPTHVLTLGTYEKVDGPETWLKFSSRFYTEPGEGEGCIYSLRVDGQDRGEDRRVNSQSFEFLNGYELPAGPHTFDIWVERKAGAGPGNCQIQSGTFEAYEKMH
jgi:hypothetical protein